MSPLPFTKMVGSGNDFILLDLRRHRAPRSLARLAQTLCQRIQGIGADGLLTVEPSPRATVTMRVFNPDGSEPAMCGNGARCAALYVAGGRAGRRVTLDTRAGLVGAQVLSAHRVRVTLTPPSPVTRRQLTVAGRPVVLWTVNTGVPHAVLQVPQIRHAAVSRLGPILRRHAAFRPAGTNVDFMQIVDRHTLRLRTYERGVEQETLACGTGAVAAALAAADEGHCQSPVTIIPASGDRLVVRGTRRAVSLEGEARPLFTGVMPR